MKAGVSNRLLPLVAAGVVAAAVAATIAYANSGSTATQAAAAPPMQLSLNGGPSFAVKSYSFRISANRTWSTAGAAVGKAVPDAFVFTKTVDKTLDETLTLLTKGKTFARGELTVSPGTSEQVTYVMTNMYVTGVREESAAGRPIDTIELVYKTLEWRVGGTVGNWDVANGKTT